MADAHRIEMTTTGGPEVLSLQPFDPPAPAPGRVRIRCRAAGLNFIDTYHRSGLYPVKLPFTPGVECAGEVEAIGDDVDGGLLGARVGYLGAGAYASHVIAPADRLVHLPDSIAFEDAAAVLLKGLTAWMLLFEVRRASPGDAALVWAPVGGVGALLTPWARSLGVEVIAVTSTPEKARKARALGANHVVMRDGDVGSQVRELTGGRGVDVAYDSVGKSSAEASLASLAPRGWWVSYGNASGPAEPVAPGRLGALGSLVMTRPSLFSFIATPADLARGAAALFGGLAAGTLKVDIGQRFTLSDIADAHRAIESATTTGATVLITQ